MGEIIIIKYSMRTSKETLERASKLNGAKIRYSYELGDRKDYKRICIITLKSGETKEFTNLIKAWNFICNDYLIEKGVK